VDIVGKKVVRKTFLERDDKISMNIILMYIVPKKILILD